MVHSILTVNEEQLSVFQVLVRKFSLRYWDRRNKLLQYAEPLEENEVRYVLHFTICSLSLLNNFVTKLDMKKSVVGRILRVFYRVLNRLHFSEIIPAIDVNIFHSLGHAVAKLNTNTRWEGEPTNQSLNFSQKISLIAMFILMIHGEYKNFTFTLKFSGVISMRKYFLIKSSEDIFETSRSEWISTLTRIKSGADFGGKFYDGECPVCCEKTSNFAITICGHGTCFRCLHVLEESETKE